MFIPLALISVFILSIVCIFFYGRILDIELESLDRDVKLAEDILYLAKKLDDLVKYFDLEYDKESFSKVKKVRKSKK